MDTPSPRYIRGVTRFQKSALATSVTTVVLFAIGGLVRGSGSGLGCSTWPNCHGDQLLPSPDTKAMIEFSHRAMVGVVSLLILITAYQAIRHFRGNRRILWPALAAIPLVFGQAILGGIVVLTELNPWWVTAHFAIALALVADVVIVSVNAFFPTREAGGDLRFARLSLVTTSITGLLLLVGTYVRATAAGLAFSDWPLMDGRLVPTLGGTNTAMFLHRVLAAFAMLLVIYTVVRARTMTGRAKPLVTLSTLAMLLFFAQIVVGAANVWTSLAPIAVIGHVALSVLIWATLVALATAARWLAPEPDPAAEAAAARDKESKASFGDTAAAYFQLTKPRIISLLLITTVPAMILAAGEVPSIWLILATLLGGTLAAGSANAINCYIDRDIDQIMKRTRRRPLPAHEVTPERALAFGYILGAISFFFLAMTVNVLAASLCLAAIVFYVFVYTLWLKRTTDQNIVIGGAAGAAPVLVGWAAVTGTVQLPAILLFAIVFIWTPPHFWALAMRYRNDYASAGVPMMPAVRGQSETLLQIWLYSLALFAVTLVMVPLANMGLLYAVTAAVLGGLFVYKALRLRREYSEAAAMRLFRFSIVYLALLFAAVAVDGLLRGTPIGL